MKQTINIIKQLRDLSGNAQIKYLKENSENTLLKQVLLYTYDPEKMYKIDSKRYDSIEVEGGQEFILNISFWKEFVVMLDFLDNSKGVKDEDVYKIKYFIENFELESRLFLKNVLFKDLRLNMGIKKFQKAWGDFCLKPQVQLAKVYNGEKFENGFYSRKMDGARSYVLDGKFYTRTNKEYKIEPIKHLIEQIQNIPNYENYVFDGEIIYTENEKEDFKFGISLLHSDERKNECDNLKFLIFDIIPKENFIKRIPYVPFLEEYSEMLKILQITKKCTSWFETIHPNLFLMRQESTEIGKTELENAYIEQGWEGLMYRANVPYEYKRTKNLLKIKKFQTEEFTVVRIETGTGKFNKIMGTMYVDFNGNEVGVGTGFNDLQRKVYWNDAHKYLNKKAVIKFFEKTVDKNGKPSLRFPVFVCFRDLDTDTSYIFAEK